MVTAAMKLKDACSLKNSYDQTRQHIKKQRHYFANIQSIIENAKEFQKSIYFCFIDYTKDFDCVDHNKLW